MTTFSPSTADELGGIVADAVATGTRLEIRGGGSKGDIGAPDRDAAILRIAGLRGIVDYDPPELVLTARAGTPLSEIEALVATESQMLAFEPFDHGPIFGRPAGASTIGGVVAANVAGSRRLTAGSARDHLLGFEAVSGRGELFVGGAKVVKNVTGYDLPKVMAGSWGRLVALTQVTLKVLPRATTRATIAMAGLSHVQAHSAMALAMRSQAEVSAAAHLPAEVNGGMALTAFRIEGFGPSVAARCAMLQTVLRETRPVDRLGEGEADALWDAVRDVKPLGTDRPLWRINVPPSGGCAVVDALEPLGARWMFDWAGGLVWLAFDGDPARVRGAASLACGHAMLVRAPATLRAAVPALQPELSGVAALSRRIRRAFDPAQVFEAGRFLDQPHAD